MRTEVHVHGTVVLVEGVSIGQVEGALRPWLDYLDCASIKEARSLEQDEPGIVFDRKRFLLCRKSALDLLGRPRWLGQTHG